MYDLIIIGAGPAGLTAGIYAARAKLNVLAIEKGIPGGQISNTALVEDYPGFEHISGADLGQKLEQHARKFGLEIVNGAVEQVKRTGEHFSIKTNEGEFDRKSPNKSVPV
jgi:thioredoxin reductase (NADPH)